MHSSLGVIQQAVYQRVERDAVAACRFDPFVHDDPRVEGYPEKFGQNRQQIWVLRGDAHLADSNPQTRTNGRDLRERVVALERKDEIVWQWKARHHGPDIGCLPVEADEAMSCEVGHPQWCAVLRQVAPVGVKAERYLSDAAADKMILGRLCHPDGNIRLPIEKVLDRVGRRKLDVEIGMGSHQRCKDGRQYLDADDLAGAYPDGAGNLISMSRGSSQQGGGCRCERLGIGFQFKGCIGWQETVRRADEELRAD